MFCSCCSLLGGGALLVRQQADSQKPAGSEALGQPLLKGLQGAAVSSIVIRQPKGALIMTPEQQAEIENFRTRATETRRELKELRKNLRQDAESLVFWTKLLNIGLMPLLVVLAGLAVLLMRRRKQVPA